MLYTLCIMVFLIGCTGHATDNVSGSSLKGGDINIDASGIIKEVIKAKQPYSICQTPYGSCQIGKYPSGASCWCSDNWGRRANGIVR